MSNDNRDPFREYNRRIQRQIDRRRDRQSFWAVVLMIVVFILLAFWALN